MLLSESSIRKIIKKLIVNEVGAKLSTSIKRSAVNTDEEDSGAIVGDDISFDSSSSVKSSVGDRAVRLGKKIGIDPAWIYAEEAKESNHIPTALAWNLHIATNNKYSKRAGAPNITPANIQKMKNATLGFKHVKTNSGGASFYGSAAKKAFAAAYKIDPWHAIAGGAWGLYQVLGAFTLPKYNNDPTAWTRAWENNTLQYCEDSLVTWVNAYGQEFKNAVNRGDYAYTTKKYYGAANSKYENFIRSHVAKYKKGLPASSKSSSKASSSWKGRLGERTGGGINFHKILDNKNNYRAGIKNKHTNPTVDFWKELAKPKNQGGYGIKNVISLNADQGGKAAANNAVKAGLNVFKNFIGEDNMGNRSKFNKAKEMLKKGNTLIHCTHGADRTGAYVGRYYMEELAGWDFERAKTDTKKYGGHKSAAGYKSARDFLQNGPD
jgi:hypothetical protein